MTIAVAFTAFTFIHAQSQIGTPGGNSVSFFNTNSQGGLLGQRQAGTFGNFGTGDQWIGIGQPIPGAYGFRTQANGNAAILALTGTGSNKKLELNWSGPGKIGSFEINQLTSFTDPNGKTNRFTIKTDGKVGIGTHSPTYKLQVQGDVYANGGWFRVSGNRGLYFQSRGGGFYMTDNTWIRTYGNKSFYHNTGIMRTDGTFQVGGNGSRFRVNTNGHVGIGQTAPKGPLHIGQQLVLSSPTTSGGWGSIGTGYWNGALRRVASAPFADMTFTNGGDIIFRTAPSGSANSVISNANHIMRIHSGRGVSINTDYLASNVQFNVNGNLTATNHWNTSDGRFKKNVKDIDNAMDKINALNGKSYQFKEKVGDYNFKAVKGKDQLGFIANELKEVLPELVQEDDNGYQSVNYIGLIPVLVEAVKEQQTVISEQAETITTQDEKIESLEARLDRLEAMLNASSNIQNTAPTSNSALLEGVILKQNAPNPFSNTSTIAYELSADLNNAALVVYDMNGKTVARYDITGNGTIQFDASELSSGTYFYAITAKGQTTATQKMIIQK